MYWTYVLINSAKNKTYTGHANNLKSRLSQHNSGKDTFTKKYRPWTVLYNEVHETESDAIKREKYLKSAAARKWIKKNLFRD